MRTLKFPEPESEHSKILNKIVDEVYNLSDDYGWEWPELAERSDLCYATVWRLGNRTTKYPQFKTVAKLCKAVGLYLTTDSSKKRQVI